jgi:hypothetical protein
MTEAKLQAAIIQTAQLAGWLAIRLNAGVAWSRDGRYPIRLAPKGTPDLLLIGPAGQLVFCECKSRRGVVSAEQATMIARLQGMDHEVIVARAVDDLAETLGLLI